MHHVKRLFLSLSLLLVLSTASAAAQIAPVNAFEPDSTAEVFGFSHPEHVILISVDGLRPDAVTRAGDHMLPNLYRLRSEAVFTDNARTDVDFSNTLPNHVGLLTGRGVVGDRGHNWTTNEDPAEGVTIHSNKSEYVASVFDVVHDAGRSTAAYVSKGKFILFDTSYDAENGAEDTIGEDNGRDKIDRFVYDSDTGDLVARLTDDLASDPANFTFLHLGDPDAAGHSRTWSLRRGSRYMDAVERVDRLVGRVLRAIEENPDLADNTTVILTADHGGSWWSHRNASSREAYTVPFYVWGPGVEPGDLYDLNQGIVHDPGSGRPTYTDATQPIRNASAANLTLTILGLPAVPGSTINATAPLAYRNVPDESIARNRSATDAEQQP